MLRCSVLYYVLFFSHSVVSDSLLPRGLQHTRLPCPSLSPGVCSHSCPLSRWCHPAVSIMSISLQLGKLIHLISNILFSVKHMNNSLLCLIVYVNQENFKISVRPSILSNNLQIVNLLAFLKCNISFWDSVYATVFKDIWITTSNLNISGF